MEHLPALKDNEKVIPREWKYFYDTSTRDPENGAYPADPKPSLKLTTEEKFHLENPVLILLFWLFIHFQVSCFAKLQLHSQFKNLRHYCYGG